MDLDVIVTEFRKLKERVHHLEVMMGVAKPLIGEDPRTWSPEPLEKPAEQPAQEPAQEPEQPSA